VRRATAGALLALIAGAGNTRAGDFADSVVAYAPAPGQFINNPATNDPALALGAPSALGTLQGSGTGVVSLGGFGGSITLKFDQRVMDGPCNPWGLDAIVFGNGFWVGGNANRKWCEAGVIEISRDANGNGLADDAWYVIPGSHIGNAPPTVTPSHALQAQAWDNNAGTPTPPGNVAWYPSAAWYPGFPGMYSTTNYRLPALFDALVVENPNGLGATMEGIIGYADCSPTLLLGDLNGDNIIEAPGTDAGAFYTAPDNPFAVGVSPGSGGGDAFDIAWAVDPVSGAPAELDGFDFIRISTGANAVVGAVGEVSTEIASVSRVRARESHFDRTGDGRADVEDVYNWHGAADDVDGDGMVTEQDRAMLLKCVRRGEMEAAAL
jgi:hypothetical protein